MKNLKRLIALVAVFALALTTIASAASFTDVAEDSAYYEAVETLTKLGIIDGYTDGTFKPEQTVTRAEMAKLLATMQGFDVSASGSVTQFSDVPASHWASGYIAQATGKAINGMPDGTFAPDAPVTYEQAVKMIMASLGYTVIANGDGGYPMGFVSAAIKEGVTKNVTNANVGTEATRGTIAQLIYNAIDTPLVEQITWEADGKGEYTKYDGTGSKAYKTLMSENLDVVKMKGIVIGNSYTTLEGDIVYDADADATVEIELTNGFKVVDNDFFDEDGDAIHSSETFLVGDTDIENYLGKAIVFYAMEDDDEWEVISVVEDTTNKETSFDLILFEDVDDDEITYDDKKTISLDDDGYAIIFNNQYYAGDLDELLSLEDGLVADKYSGTVTAIDYNKGGADVVIVEAAASGVVESVEDGVITFDPEVVFPDETISEIDTDDEDVILVITKDGKEIDVNDIAKKDVVSVIAASEDADYIIVDVMSNVIEGSIDRTSTSDANKADVSYGGKSYRIDGTYYPVAAGCDVDIEVGDEGVFYIDKFGKIAYFEKGSSASGNFAFVLADLASKDGIDGKTYEIRLLTKNGVKIYEVADNYKVNDESFKVKNIAFGEDEKEVSDVHDIVGKLVDVTFSGEYVKNITVEGFDDDVLSDGEELTGAFDAEDGEIGNKTIDEDATIFFLKEEGGSYVSSECFVGTLADLTESDEVGEGSLYYTTEKTKEDASVLVLVNTAMSVNAASKLAVIIDADMVKNDDGEKVLAVTALYDGKEVDLMTTADVYDDNSGLESGTVVKVKVTASGLITDLEVIADELAVKRTDGAAIAQTIDYTGKDTIVGGYATEISKNSKKLVVDGEEIRLSKATNVYVIDYTERKLSIKKGSSASFKFEDRFFDGSADGKSIVVDDEVIGTVGEDDELVADYVIYRAYEGADDVYEVVIVKGPSYKLK